MALVAGARLGPYEIVAPIGQGGMGEVYRARDTRLERTVAIKVLPLHLAADPQFRERFDREARLISSLSHPHICPLFDVGNADGVDFLVMEHLEGETLASRLEKGPLPLDHALTTAIEIASALDAAHRAGVIHRDLKPGNIFLTRNGARLLDFGLAKSDTGRVMATSAIGASAFGPTALPTTPPAATITAQGTILGTFQYMAPEQLEGQGADSRTDIFAFGCVLFEMVTGRKAFQGKTQVSLIGAILKDDPPPVSTVQALSPAAFDFVVRKCLAKDPDRRWQTASDLVSQLEWIAQGSGQSVVAAGVPPAASRVARGRYGVSPALAAGAAILLAALAGAGVWFLKPSPPSPPHSVVRFPVVLPAGQTFSRTGRHFLAISPDGTKVVYVANQQLYLRSMDQLEAVPIRGTNVDPINPFFSPDGQWVGFFAGNQLRKIAIAGGAAVKLCEAANPYGVSWSGDRVVFGQGTDGIFEVSANGGTPRLLAKVDGAKGELAHGPQLLPGGDALLFTLAPGQLWSEARAVVQSLKSGERKVVLEGATDARYVETGHLVFGHETTVLAVPFDLQRLEVTGGPVALVEGVNEAVPTGAVQFALSGTGSLAFVPGTADQGRTLAWVDRQGVETPIPAGTRPFTRPRISPDGTRVAVEISDAEQAIWIWEFLRGTMTRLTFGRASDLQPRWTPDGRRVLYSSTAGGVRSVYSKAADGTGAAERLTKGAEAQEPRSLTPDGKWLLVLGVSAVTGNDQNLVSLEDDRPDRQVRPLLRTAFSDGNGEISGDGRWIAYQSNETGNQEIYVRPFPDVDKGRWQVSTSGGIFPRWSHDGRELFYVGLAHTSLMAATVRTDGPSFTAAKPIQLFSLTSYVNAFDVAADGRFLMVKRGGSNQQQQIVVVQNWFDELKSRVTPR